jgi:hypothetical protein
MATVLAGAHTAVMAASTDTLLCPRCRRAVDADLCPSCGLPQTGDQIGRLRAIVARLDTISRAQYALTAESAALRAEYTELLRGSGPARQRRPAGRRPSPARRSCGTSSSGWAPPSSPSPP